MAGRKKVAILTTGGTIAGVSYGPVLDWGPAKGYRLYNAGVVSGQKLVKQFPSLEEIADIIVIDLGKIDSVNLNMRLLNEFGGSIYSALSREDIDGVVLTHGTDTMEFTSMGLSLMLQNLKKPVVMTGAIAPPDQLFDHVRTHLEDSVRAAAYSGVNEVLVCYAGDENTTFTNLYQGPHIFKESPRSQKSFESHLVRPIGVVKDGEIRLRQDYERPVYDEEPRLVSGFSGDVCNFYFSVIGSARAIANIDCSGIVARVEGNPGHSDEIYKTTERLLKRGIPVAFAGFCRRTDYLGDQSPNDIELIEKGAAYLGNMMTNKAIIKLSWAVAQTGANVGKTQALMYKNVAGEMLPSFYK